MKKLYEHGFDCCYEHLCKKSCKDCNFYSKEYNEIDFGKCKNSSSENYNCEVYDHACCDYVCKNKKDRGLK